MSKHWIAMSGVMVGCLPEFCEPFQKRKEAVDTLADLHEMSHSQHRTLRKEGVVGLGMGYAEVVECNCKTPGVHTEDGKVEWDA